MIRFALYFFLLCMAKAQEASLGTFQNTQHRVDGEVVVISESVIEIRGFTYDGTAPAVYFWGDTSPNASRGGYILNDAAPLNSCGSAPLPRQNVDGSTTYVIEFPEGMTIRDIAGGSISVWCEAFAANFGQVQVPETLNVASTSDGPALSCSDSPTSTEPTIADTPVGFNCEPLSDDFQVRWAVEGENLLVELIGRIQDNQYMGFGPSGSSDSTSMDDAAPLIADVFGDEFRVRDFYISDRSRCSNGVGVCPDTDMQATDDVDMVSGEEDMGLTLIRYRTPIVQSDVDSMLDVSYSVEPGVSTFVVWAIGPVSDTGLPLFHTSFPRTDVSIEFGRDTVDNCTPMVDDNMVQTVPPVQPFNIPLIVNETLIDAHIGPSGGPRGYPAITGNQAWGIAWYLNGLLIPEMVMQRGTTYTFRVNGGDEPDNNSRFHPFYLTTSASGGYATLTPEMRAMETVLAGIDVTETDTSGGVTAFESTAVAPICSYQATDETDENLEGSFQEYFGSLDVSCRDDQAIVGNAAILEFTPDSSTPDRIYYHCVTHPGLGWKIRVIDEGETLAPTSAPTSSPTGTTGSQPSSNAPTVLGIISAVSVSALVVLL